MDLSDRWQRLQDNLQKDEDDRDAQYQGSLQPGDTSTPADTWGNKIKSAVGAPDSWQQTIADQKYNAVQPKPVEAGMPAYANPAAAEEGIAQGASKLTPELEALANQIKGNPNMPLQVSGAMDMGRFQKLRDMLGHVGPIIMKGGQ